MWMPTQIPFNRPFITGKELDYISQAIDKRELAADGYFTTKCSRLLEQTLSIKRVLMTPSGTAALEMAALLCDLKPGDEVILPSFTFTSTTNAFVRDGARPVFVEIRPDTLNLDESLIEQAITERTRAIFPVHYAGVSCEMDRILKIAAKHNLLVVEDAAQGVNSFYNQRALGSIGDLGAYSFHHTKNFICGEGGALCVNSPELAERAEIIREKGTNRSKFIRGEVDKYTWVDIGSSALPSEILCAFLLAQLEMMEAITARRRQIYEFYFNGLKPLEERGLLIRPSIPPGCVSNYHLFHILLPNASLRNELLAYLSRNGIQSAFHYVPLHSSPMGQRLGYKEGDLPITEELSARSLRLPFFNEITEDEQVRVVNCVASFLTESRI
jgi:dTDP-4-amino-4,6-dideoxygalactose transaminase